MDFFLSGLEKNPAVFQVHGPDPIVYVADAVFIDICPPCWIRRRAALLESQSSISAKSSKAGIPSSRRSMRTIVVGTASAFSPDILGMSLEGRRSGAMRLSPKTLRAASMAESAACLPWTTSGHLEGKDGFADI